MGSLQSINTKKFYVWATAIVVLLLVVSAACLEYMRQKQENDGRVINVAGKQRMYSQRIALIASQMTVPEKRDIARAKLQKDLNAFKKAHQRLIGGEWGDLSSKVQELYFLKKIKTDRGDVISLDEFFCNILKVFQNYYDCLKMN
jgi:nitrate/nitrite-specific signal transduction histidine kinase